MVLGMSPMPSSSRLQPSPYTGMFLSAGAAGGRVGNSRQCGMGKTAAEAWTASRYHEALSAGEIAHSALESYATAPHPAAAAAYTGVPGTYS